MELEKKCKSTLWIMSNSVPSLRKKDNRILSLCSKCIYAYKIWPRTGSADLSRISLCMNGDWLPRGENNLICITYCGIHCVFLHKPKYLNVYHGIQRCCANTNIIFTARLFNCVHGVIWCHMHSHRDKQTYYGGKMSKQMSGQWCILQGYPTNKFTKKSI